MTEDVAVPVDDAQAASGKNSAALSASPMQASEVLSHAELVEAAIEQTLA
jgi:hypothetical protein